MRFFLHAAQYAEIELSPLFKTPKAPASGTRKPRTRRKQDPENGKGEETPPPPPTDAPELIQNLLKQLPPEGAEWDADKAEYWLGIARMTFNMVYTWKDGKELGLAPSPKRAGGDG